MMRVGRLALTVLATLGVFGSALTLTSVPALAAAGHPFRERLTGFNEPSGVAVDSAGEIYVAEEGSDAVEKVDSTGAPTNFSDSGTPGLEYISGSKLTGTPEGPFGNLTSIAVDSAGDIYVGDAGNHVVDIFDAAGVYQGQLTQADGVTPFAFGTFEPLTGAGGIHDITIDSATGDIYAVNEDARVLDVFNPAGVFIVQLPVSTTFLQSAAIDDSTGNLYLGFSLGSGRVEVETPTGTPVATWSGVNGGPFKPCGGDVGCKLYMAVDDSTGLAAGQVFVDSNGTGIVDVLDASGNYLSQLTGGPGFTFGGISAMSVDSSGNLYVIDGDALDVFGVGPLPDILTGTSASDVTATTATVSGSVNPVGGLDAHYFFEYGLDSKYSSGTTTPGDAGSTTLPAPGQSVSADLTGLQPNTTYHYRLDGSNAIGENTGLDQTFTTLPVLPTVNDRPSSASSVTHTSAVLSGTINPENAPTFYHFIYGMSSAYGSAGPELEAGSSFGDETLEQAIGGLQAGTTYHYALVATNEEGTVMGPDETFTTTPLTPPALATGGVSEVTETTATLSGAIDTQDEYTGAYGFDLGIDTNYTQAFVVGHAEAGEDVSRTVTQNVQGLEPGTTYHYRLFATNTDGTTHSTDQTFTTAGPPNPSTVLDILVVPGAIPLVAPPTLAFPSEAGARATTVPKALTNAQKLANALKGCKKARPKSRRRKCEAAARKKYAPAKKRKGR